MECPNGSECTESTHPVKTMKKAREWWPEVNYSDLPLVIHQSKAYNGRLRVIVSNVNNDVVYRKG